MKSVALTCFHIEANMKIKAALKPVFLYVFNTFLFSTLLWVQLHPGPSTTSHFNLLKHLILASTVQLHSSILTKWLNKKAGSGREERECKD